MKEYLRTLIQANPDPLQKRNIAREYLQARILESMQRMGAFVPLAFQGGTALRFLYGLKRFSEDLDFSLENKASPFDFNNYMQRIQNVFISEGYRLEILCNTERIVHSGLLKFSELLNELDLSPYKNENLSIKIEVDTNPPNGAKMETSLVRRYLYLNLYHYDRASLFAGKIHALLSRKFIKGRDVYDLLWYLSDPNWPLPNFTFLENSLTQTGWTGEIPCERNWRSLLQKRIGEMNWKRVVEDVEPFLEEPKELDILTKENVLALLDKR